MNWIAERLGERSTYVGITVLLGLAGVSVPVEGLELLGGAALAMVGLVESARGE